MKMKITRKLLNFRSNWKNCNKFYNENGFNFPLCGVYDVVEDELFLSRLCCRLNVFFAVVADVVAIVFVVVAIGLSCSFCSFSCNSFSLCCFFKRFSLAIKATRSCGAMYLGLWVTGMVTVGSILMGRGILLRMAGLLPIWVDCLFLIGLPSLLGVSFRDKVIGLHFKGESLNLFRGDDDNFKSGDCCSFSLFWHSFFSTSSSLLSAIAASAASLQSTEIGDDGVVVDDEM